MESRPLIFQCVFTDEEFKKLEKIRDTLADLIFDIHEVSVSNFKLLPVKFEFTLLDFRDILIYRNAKGYKWNSYTLSIVLLKMDYIYEVLKDSTDIISNHICTVLQDEAVKLLEILATKYDEFQSRQQ